ncbi:MAG: DUF3168 domain-containing protein [Anaerolineaceae bacterium]
MSIAAQWLISELKGNAEITALIGDRIHSYVAPEQADYPFVVIHEITSPPLENQFADRIGDQENWMIKVYQKGSSDVVADDIDRKIRTLLHKKTGANIISCVARQRLTQAEQDANGNPIRAIIRYYEILVS